ncbi:hypothetical protein ACVIM8_005726 [Bradyrhizobium sp. USDA 4529]
MFNIELVLQQDFRRFRRERLAGAEAKACTSYPPTLLPGSSESVGIGPLQLARYCSARDDPRGAIQIAAARLNSRSKSRYRSRHRDAWFSASGINAARPGLIRYWPCSGIEDAQRGSWEARSSCPSYVMSVSTVAALQPDTSVAIFEVSMAVLTRSSSRAMTPRIMTSRAPQLPHPKVIGHAAVRGLNSPSFSAQ